ncbi:hypothetical protein GEMRC1_005677 [Eukaryota sp. GEM-RC1]
MMKFALIPAIVEFFVFGAVVIYDVSLPPAFTASLALLSLLFIILFYFVRLTTKARTILFPLFFVIIVAALISQQYLSLPFWGFSFVVITVCTLLMLSKKPLSQQNYFIIIVISAVLISLISNYFMNTTSTKAYLSTAISIFLPLLFFVLNLDKLYEQWIKYNDPVSAGIYLYIESHYFFIALLRFCCGCCDPKRVVDENTRHIVDAGAVPL